MEKSQKYAVAILLCVTVMFLLPWAVLTFAPSDSGMAFFFILWYAINPLFSIGLGVYAGRELKRRWTLPVLSALAYWLFIGLLLSIAECWVLLYAGVYLLLSTVAMLVSALITARARR